MGVDETGHHGHRPRSRSAGRGAAPVPTACTVPCDTSIHPGRNSSEPVKMCQRQQHSNALPFRLGAVGLAVVVDQLKAAGRGVIEQHRHMRVMLQDGRRP